MPVLGGWHIAHEPLICAARLARISDRRTDPAMTSGLRWVTAPAAPNGGHLISLTAALPALVNPDGRYQPLWPNDAEEIERDQP